MKMAGSWLTTPNAFFLLHMIESVFRSPDDSWNPEHVCWYEPFTLRNVLKRNNLEVDTMYYFTRSRKLLRLMQLTGLPSYGPAVFVDPRDRQKGSEVSEVRTSGGPSLLGVGLLLSPANPDKRIPPNQLNTRQRSGVYRSIGV